MFERLSRKTKKQFKAQKPEEGEVSRRYKRGSTTVLDTYSNTQNEQIYTSGFNSKGKQVDISTQIANGQFSQAELEEELKTAKKLKGVRKQITLIRRGK